MVKIVCLRGCREEKSRRTFPHVLIPAPFPAAFVRRQGPAHAHALSLSALQGADSSWIGLHDNKRTIASFLPLCRAFSCMIWPCFEAEAPAVSSSPLVWLDRIPCPSRWPAHRSVGGGFPYCMTTVLALIPDVTGNHNRSKLFGILKAIKGAHCSLFREAQKRSDRGKTKGGQLCTIGTGPQPTFGKNWNACAGGLLSSSSGGRTTGATRLSVRMKSATSFSLIR